MAYYENPAKQTQRIEFLRNKETGKIIKAHRHQIKAFIDSGSCEIVSLEERAEIEAGEAEKKVEEAGQASGRS